MMRLLRTSLILVIAMIGVMQIGVAHADQTTDAIQLVCLPEANYFSVEWRSFYDVDIDQWNRLHRSDAAALVWPQALKAKPFDCRWRDHAIRVSWVPIAFKRKPRASSCETEISGNIEIAWDGKKISCLDGSHSETERRQSDTLTVGRYSKQRPFLDLEHCSVTLESDHEGNFHCSGRSFDISTGNPRT